MLLSGRGQWPIIAGVHDVRTAIKLMLDRIGKYRVIREIGKGATATVYLCKSDDLDELVAVKLVDFGDKNRDQGKWSRRMRKLFLTEAAIAAKLDHPNIIRIFDAQVEEGRAYLVMEYIEGEALDHYCEFNKMLPLSRAVSIVFKCCMALDYAFRQGVVHRDIKPANILIGANDLVKVTDFGLALNIAKENDKDSTFIMGVGSPAYMSPEQVKGYPLNQKTDLYSLGVVLFHLLTGRLPFRAKHPAQLIYKIINADPPSASQLNPRSPRGDGSGDPQGAREGSVLALQEWCRVRQGSVLGALQDSRRQLPAAGHDALLHTAQDALLHRVRRYRGVGSPAVFGLAAVSRRTQS
jgi:serine/threonine protein kinase